MTTIFEKLETEKRTHARLSDFIKIKHGYAFKGEYFGDKGSHVVITPGNFFEEGGFRRREHKDKWYSGSIPEEYILDKGDVVIAMTEQGEGLLGSSAIIPSGDLFLHNQRIGSVEIKDEKSVDRVFLYNLFNSRRMRSYIQASASGTKVRHTAPDRITSYEYDFPSLPMQKKIGEILSAYDEKISSNNEAIANLEEIAATLFDEWFTKFNFPGREKITLVKSDFGLIPMGWETKRLGDAVELAYGKALTSENREFGPYPVVGSSGIVGFNKNALVSGPGIVVGRKGNAGSVIWLDDDFFPIDTTFYVKTTLPMTYCYFLLKRLQFSNSDSAVPGLGREDAYSQTVLVADDEIIEAFDRYVMDLFRMRARLKIENIQLRGSRDLLLSKLV